LEFVGYSSGGLKSLAGNGTVVSATNVDIGTFWIEGVAPILLGERVSTVVPTGPAARLVISDETTSLPNTAKFDARSCSAGKVDISTGNSAAECKNRHQAQWDKPQE